MRVLFSFLILFFFSFLSLQAEEIFNPYTHRIVLRKNIDRAATVELVSRNPERFEGYFVGFEGHILDIKERGKLKITTYLLCSNGRDRFVVILDGKSDRFSRGLWVEVYGNIVLTDTPFDIQIPVVKSTRVLTPEDVQKDSITQREANYFLLAEKNGGFLEFALQLIKKGELKEAETLLKFGIKYDKKTTLEKYYINLARLYYSQGRFQEVKKYCHLIIHKNMDMEEAQFLLGRSEMILGNFKMALRYFNRSIKLNSKRNPWKYIAEIYFKMSRFKESENYFKVSLSHFPDDPELMRFGGILNETLGNLEEARSFYKEYLKISPSDVEIKFKLKNIDRLMAKLERTLIYNEEKRYRKILERSFKLFGIEYRFLNSNFKPQNMVEKELLWAVEYKNSDYRLYNYLGLYNLYHHRFNEALSFFKLSIKLEKNLAELHYNLGFAYYFTDRFDDSMDEFNIAYSMNSMMKRALDFRNFVVEIKKLTKKYGNRPRQRSKLHREYGELLYTKNDLIMAEFNFLESLRFREDNFGSLFNLACLKIGIDDQKGADFYVKKMLMCNKKARRYIPMLQKMGYTLEKLKHLGYRSNLNN